MNMFTSGNPICDAMAEIHLEGNIIPSAWYHTVTKGGEKNHPHLLAIVILADIAYWYRPAPIRDEDSGALIGFKKKFRSDLLQRNYKQIAAQFGCSVCQAKDAIRFLEELEVIRRIFRDVEMAAGTLNNVMYIKLNPDRLRELTYPSVEISTEGGTESDGGGEAISGEVGGLCPPTPSEITRDTETTTEVTPETTAEVPSIPPSDAGGEMEGKSDLLPGDKNNLRIKIERLCELEHHRKYGFYPSDTNREHMRLPVYELAVECLVEMCTGSCRDTLCEPAEVRKRVQAVVEYDQALCYCIEEVMEAFIDANQEREIKNARKYMRAMLWDYLHTYVARNELSCGF